MRTTPRTRTFATLVVVASLVFPVTTATAAAPNVDRLLAARPYIRLWTEANSCRQVSNANSLSGAALDRRLDQLVRWFDHFNSQGSNRFLLGRDCTGSGSSTLASKLTARGAWVSNYRNGSFTSQSSRSANLNFYEAANLERTAPLAIGTFWPGDWAPYHDGERTSSEARLRGDLSRTSRTVRITAVSAASRPAGTPGTWPFIDSRGSGSQAGAFSQNTHDVVSWIRVGTELMQIVEPPTVGDGVIRLHVRRGIWRTDARRHGGGSRVFSPVYVGSSSRDAHLSGTPSKNDRNVPLRYALKIWTNAAQRWLIGRIHSTFGSSWQGHNAVWLDTTSCVQYSNADPYGNQVFGWDDRVDAKITPERWGAAQRTKVAAVRDAFPRKKVLANNLINRNACTERLLADVDAGAFEHWLKWGNGQELDWSDSMSQLIDVQRRDWPAMLWVRWDYGSSVSPAQYRRFTYGSYLLVRRPGARRTMYGGPWDLMRPEDLYFWDWGDPRERATVLNDLRVAGTPLFRRRYEHGIVLVNPSSSAVAFGLGATYYDVVNRTTSAAPRAVTSVTVPAHDAVFLLGAR
jgi:hypothetical protein